MLLPSNIASSKLPCGRAGFLQDDAARTKPEQHQNQGSGRRDLKHGRPASARGRRASALCGTAIGLSSQPSLLRLILETVSLSHRAILYRRKCLTSRIRTLVVALPLKTEPCARLLAYWDALRGDRLLPGRAEIDPAALVAVLLYVSIVELRDPDTMIYRLCGTALRDIMGIEATGLNMLDLAPPAGRRQRAYRNWTAATRPCATAYEMNLTYPSGAVYVHEGISLPVAPPQGGAPALLLRA